ncbi:hypothetical protein GN956_G8161 [Arapaima gigas]
MANKCVADEQLMKPKSLEGLSAAGSINETSQSHFGSPGSGMLHLSLANASRCLKLEGRNKILQYHHFLE